MSYCGSVGTLIAGTSIQEILSTASGHSGCVLKMSTGKKYPQNDLAFRLLTEELLRPIFTKHHA